MLRVPALTVALLLVPALLAAQTPERRPHLLRADAFDLQGLARTDSQVVLHAIRLSPGSVLTAERIHRSKRRLADLPFVSTTDFLVTPENADYAKVTYIVEERDLVPRTLRAWAFQAARMVMTGEASLDVVGILHSGDVLSGGYRWAPEDRRATLSGAAPAPAHVPGLLFLDTSWERATYRPSEIAGATNEIHDRIHAGARLTDWLTSRVKWEAGVGGDRFDTQDAISGGGALDTRWMADRLSIAGGSTWWAPVGGGRGFHEADTSVWWRSSVDVLLNNYSAIAGVTSVSDAAPLALWPGASSGHFRGVLLRAHDLTDSNIVVGSMIGREMAYASLEYERTLKTLSVGSLGLAGFLDMARAARRIDALPPAHFEADLGAGLRAHSTTLGALRVDFAVGLRDGHLGISVGWIPRWPSRERQ